MRPTGRTTRRHYGFHAFQGRKDPGVVQAYLEHYTGEGDLVLDAFVGSGTTAREALILRRRVVAMDINPVAELITRASVLPVDLDGLVAGFERLETRVAKDILAIEHMSDRAIADCLADFDLRFLEKPIHRVIRRGKGRGLRTLRDLQDDRQILGLLLLRDGIAMEPDDRVRLILRTAFSGSLKYASKMYRGRKSKGYWSGDATPFVHFAYQVPEHWTYKNVWEVFGHVWQNVLAGKRETQDLIGEYCVEGQNFFFLRGSATNLREQFKAAGLPDSQVVDYCITDPPYAEKIQYPLLYSLWYPWLEMAPPNPEEDLTVIATVDEARKGGVDQRFVAKFDRVIDEIGSVIKPGGWLSLFYQHENLSYWSPIVGSARDRGLHYVNLVPQPQNVRSYAQEKHPFKAIAGTLILNFRKLSSDDYARSYGRTNNRVVFRSLHKYAELEVQRVIVEYLGADTETLAFHLIPALLDPSIATEKVDEALTLIDLIKDNELAAFGVEHVDGLEKDLWILREGVEIDPAIDFYDQLRYHLFAFLRRRGEATIHELNAEATKFIAPDPDRIQTNRLDLGALLPEFADESDGKWRYSVHARRGAVQLRLLLARSSADQLRSRFFTGTGELLQLRMEGMAELRAAFKQSREAAPSGEFRRLQNLLIAVLSALRDRFAHDVLGVYAIDALAAGSVNLDALELEDIPLGITVDTEQFDPWDLRELLAREIFGRVFIESGVMFVAVVDSPQSASWLQRADEPSILLLGPARGNQGGHD